MTNYFNTTNETGPDLKRNEAHNESQNKRVLWTFRHCETAAGYTPRQVHRRINNVLEPNIDLSDVKRAITVLTKKGKLIKTDHKVIEEKGRPNFLWKLNTD